MNIERAQRKDLPEILALQKRAYYFEAEKLNDFTIEPLTQTLEQVQREFEQGVVLKAVSGTAIIGSVRGYAKDGTLYVGKLMVHPDLQNRGIGTKLLRAVEQEYPGLRCELFTNSQNEKNVAFYTRHGYREFKRKQILPGLTFVFMEKTER